MYLKEKTLDQGQNNATLETITPSPLYIIFLTLFIYSSVSVLISSSLLCEPSMTFVMSKASSNDVVQCLTPFTDFWGPTYDKYHITRLTQAIQAINYPITVSNPAFVLLS